jgi:hypothetical protein
MRLVLLATATALLIAAPAAAGKTYQVAGKQIAVDEDNGIYKMRGSLIGRWTVDTFQEAPTGPYFHATGTETFKGCLDKRRDHRCKHDPKGTLSFTFEYWALFASDNPDSLVWGSCWHPVTGGTGDFAGAQGVLAMVDTPTKHGVETRYIGNVKLGGKSGYGSPVRATRAGGC